MMNIRMLCEELLKHVIVLLPCAINGQLKINDLYGGIMVLHVMPQSHFTVVLLLTDYPSILGNLHQGNFLFMRSQQHEHARCKIAT
jgi:hypothetical protein